MGQALTLIKSKSTTPPKLKAPFASSCSQSSMVAGGSLSRFRVICRFLVSTLTVCHSPSLTRWPAERKQRRSQLQLTRIPGRTIPGGVGATLLHVCQPPTAPLRPSFSPRMTQCCYTKQSLGTLRSSAQAAKQKPSSSSSFACSSSSSFAPMPSEQSVWRYSAFRGN